MIIADDLRPELGCYGCAHMQTPHIDAFARDAVTFMHAYVSVAWCSPSRTAFLTSRLPDTSRVWSVEPSEYWRQRGGNFSTLPQYFRKAGFLTLGIGKVQPWALNRGSAREFKPKRNNSVHRHLSDHIYSLSTSVYQSGCACLAFTRSGFVCVQIFHPGAASGNNDIKSTLG